MDEECVYVLGTPGSNIVKIGRSTDVQQRVADIQRMSPVPLEVLWTHPGGPRLEAGLHRLFADLRSHGEWFRFDGDPVDSIRTAVESGAWMTLIQPRQRKPRERSPEELAREKAALEELDELTAAFLESQQELDRARDELQATIVTYLRERRLPPGVVAERSPYDRNHVRRIADAAGVQPLRKPTAVGIGSDTLEDA